MKKIRINELARELEVKPGVILELLPELGVHEKKTHSSSIDEDVAIVLRQRLTGSGVSAAGSDGPETTNGHVHEPSTSDTHDGATAAGPPAQAAEPSATDESAKPVRASLHPPLRRTAADTPPAAPQPE